MYHTRRTYCRQIFFCFFFHLTEKADRLFFCTHVSLSCWVKNGWHNQSIQSYFIMAGKTKMIIITSDEDVIRQFSLHQTNKVQIIDYDRVKQTISDPNDDNILINSAAFAKTPESVCISFWPKSLKNFRITLSSKQIMINCQNVHSIRLIKIHRKQQKYLENHLI